MNFELSAGIFPPPLDGRLKQLADPSQLREDLEFTSAEHEFLCQSLFSMWRIRLVEETIAELVTQKKVNCPCHLCIGQEAVAVGICGNLSPLDKVFGAHRSHGHYLARGASLPKLLAEVLGKDSGCARGMGGSMHLYDASVGFQGSVPIVGASIPIAVGAGLALKMDGKAGLAVSFFGDGASEEGVFHESLNLAASQNIPVLFVSENNLYASHLDIALRQSSDSIARFATAHAIPSLLVDGNDVVAVYRASMQLCRYIRSQKKPAFLEAVTYRWRGHVGPDENIDVGLRRKAQDLFAWKQRDPITRLQRSLLKNSVLSEDQIATMKDSLRQEIQNALQAALIADYPANTSLLNRVHVHSRYE